MSNKILESSYNCKLSIKVLVFVNILASSTILYILFANISSIWQAMKSWSFF